MRAFCLVLTIALKCAGTNMDVREKLMLKKIGIGLVGLIVLLVVVGFFLPAQLELSAR